MRMNIEPESLEQMDEYLVCATVSGRLRLGVLGVVSIPAPNGEEKNHTFFYDFTQDEQEPLMPVGVINSTQEIVQNFGLWNLFPQSQPEFSAWAEQVNSDQAITLLSAARAFLCSTGKLQLPDIETLLEQTLSQRIQGKSLGFEMSHELVDSWLKWAFQEDENSRNYSRGRKKLAQAIDDLL